MATNDQSFVHLHPLRTMLSFSGTRTAIPPFSNGVYLNPHAESGVTLMACDGQTMGVWHDADGYAASAAVYIPYDLLPVMSPG